MFLTRISHFRKSKLTISNPFSPGQLPPKRISRKPQYIDDVYTQPISPNNPSSSAKRPNRTSKKPVQYSDANTQMIDGDIFFKANSSNSSGESPTNSKASENSKNSWSVKVRAIAVVVTNVVAAF